MLASTTAMKNLIEIPTAHELCNTTSDGPNQVCHWNVKAPMCRPQKSLFRSDAAYIVTGALQTEGLGFLNAKWLVDSGVRHLVLCGRSPPKDLSKFQQFREQGVNVMIAQVDVCDGPSLRKKLDKFLGHIPICGVFHAAAVFRDHLFRDTTNAEFAEVLKPKVLGSLVLADVLKKEPLEVFVMHSSIVSVTGNLGQTAYGAANNFLDSFAVYRSNRKLPAQSINWTSLSGVGVLAGDEKMEQHLKETRGFESLARTSILQALEAVLLLGSPQLTVATFDWATVQHSVLSHNSLIQGRFHTLSKEGGVGILSDSQTQIDVRDCDVPQRVEEILLDVLAPDERSSLRTEQRSLPALGLQSGDAITARQRLNRQLGVNIPLDQLLNLEQSTADLIRDITLLLVPPAVITDVTE